ncbi:MAG: hypothetical protein Q7U13_00525 [Rhodoferax sp.]|nr:hypothetical protein [Rhodoferax sp.]
MDLWTTRADSLVYLENSGPDRLAVLSRVFELIDLSIDAYESLAGGDVYARICGLTLLKAKHLAVGAYSLILDGLAQEAGALIRPFIEYSELLTYFRSFPEMAERAAENDLPKAGERARAIDGIFKEFRDHLNSHASHSSYSHYSLSHLLEPKTFGFKKLQRAVPSVLDRNVRDFIIQLYLLAREGVLNLDRLEVPNFDALAAKTDQLKGDLVHVFDLHAA